MTEKTGVTSGQASSKPTQDDDLKQRKLQYLAKLRQGQTTAAEAETKKKVILQKVKEVEWPTEGKLIPDLNHTYRLKRMRKVFGTELINRFREESATLDDFKMALFKAEQAASLPVFKKDKPYLPLPNSSGASPVKIVWKDKEYEIDAQSDFKVEYCDLLIKYMEPMRSLKSFSGEIEVPYSTVIGWMKRYKCFQFAYEIAEAKALKQLELISYYVSTGQDLKRLNENFGFHKPNAQMLQFISKSKFRKDFFEYVTYDDKSAKTLDALTGEDLEKAVARIKERHDRINTPSPFGTLNLYTGE